MLESKTFLVWFGATLLMCAISCGQGLSAQEVQHSITKPVDTYRIGVGDRIQLDVWRHPELTKTVVVDSKGNITLPSVHVVKVSGLSPMDLASVVRHKLERKIPKPQVTVSVVGIGTHWTPLPQPQHQDLPSPELRQGCCVAKIDSVTMAKS
jgi:polysaccharide biosynthesis/export protein